ncbi:MAG TPA: SRPBCC family protein [Terracidiphilus sp.]|nr:SRPBCC family protein [Terracidiphilus sp.]
MLRAFFSRSPVRASVATQVRLAAPPQDVWRCIRFYEEIAARPPLLLRLLVPVPVRSEGDKATVGSKVMCVYNSGTLIKRITALEEPRRIEFELIEQHLGIEQCVIAEGGSYRIEASGRLSAVTLTTNYLTWLRPRSLWAPLESIAIHQLHRHILRGMRRNLAAAKSTSVSAANGALHENAERQS